MWVRPLADADASCGGKALGLARLIAAGLPVPDGFAIDDRAFHHAAGALPAELARIGHALEEAAVRLRTTPLPAELEREVTERAAALGELAVRSSATIEDGALGSAAGVFSSRTAVEPRSVWWAIRNVWESALTPLAARYTQTRRAALAIGVIVQRYVDGQAITVYTRPPGAPGGDEAWIQPRFGELSRIRRDAGDPVVTLALAAEAAIGSTSGADVELVRAHDGALWVVQARPIVHPSVATRIPPPPIVLAPLVADGRTWTWDAAHNPDPLSVAQAGLVERVEQAGIAPWSSRVCGGYLYTTPREDLRVELPADLDAAIADLEARMQHALGDDPPGAREAIARYLAFYKIWARELSPLVAAHARALGPAYAATRRSIVHDTLTRDLLESEVFARLGALAPAWDVAAPTFGEQPGLLRDAMARAQAVVHRSQQVSAVSDLGERDDMWFAKAQRMIRFVLLARASELGLSADDIFWLPLDDLEHDLDLDDARRRASAARKAATLAARWQMPVVVNGPSGVTRELLHGIGVGPRVVGRVVRYDQLIGAVTVGPGDIVVCNAVTPALAVLVIGCAAIVCETGGLLDHGAALARELGITCVVNCHDAWARLGDGTIVGVDGDRGAVEIIA